MLIILNINEKRKQKKVLFYFIFNIIKKIALKN